MKGFHRKLRFGVHSQTSCPWRKERRRENSGNFTKIEDIEMPTIKLQSSDGETFPVEVDIARQSVTIRTMLEDLGMYPFLYLIFFLTHRIFTKNVRDNFYFSRPRLL